MSKFKTYAQRVDSMAQEIFEEYTEVQAKFEKAEKRHKDFPQRYGVTDYDYVTQSARAMADYAEAKKRLEDVGRRMAMKVNEIEGIGRELAEAIDRDCSVDPARLDMATLELLKSGILRSAEYTSLMEDAQRTGNVTMQRIIGKYAGETAVEASKEYGQGDKSVTELQNVALQGSASSGRDQLEAFGALCDTFKRTANNPSMIPYWDSLTCPIIEAF